MDGRGKIKINATLTIPFHTAQSIAHVFPLFLNNVTIHTKEHINNSSFKRAKLEIALDRLRKLLRHPRVLREIAMRNFSLWGRKKFIEGQKLIYMFGSARLTGGFDIIIKSLKQAGTMANGKNPNSKVMSISNWRVNGPMIDLVETIAHELGHAYGMKEYGGAYSFGWLIKDMYKLKLWKYKNIPI